MKNLYFLILLLTTSTGFASPPVIQTPTDVTSCQGYVFDLYTKVPEIFGSLNQTLYSINYYLSYADADANTNAIPNPDTFVPANSEIIYVRVEDNANSADYSLTSFNMTVELTITGVITTSGGTVCGDATVTFQGFNGVSPYSFSYTVNNGPTQFISTANGEDFVSIVLPAPGSYDILLQEAHGGLGGFCNDVFGGSVHFDANTIPTPLEPLNLSVEDIPFDGSAVFDLTNNDGLLVNGDPNVYVTYYSSLIDAQNATNPIANPAAFVGSNGQQIGVRVYNAGSSCFAIKSFYLYITNPDIVFIPDPYFKQQLIFTQPTVDTNSDGEIQVTEALAYTYLSVNGTGITSLVGLNSFINLTHFAIENSNVSTMDISALTSLTEIFCDNNQFTSLDVSHSPNLTNLQFANNQLTSLNISGLTHLQYLSCYINHLTSINVAGMNTLESLDCRNNQLTSLDLSGLTNLQILNCNTNLLTTLDVTNSPNLLQLACGFNPIPTLDVSPYPNLTYLACGSPQLNSVDISSLTHLTIFYMYGSQQTALDISNSHSITYTIVHDCPNLNILNLKNGYAALNFSLLNLPNLNFICANDSNFTSLNAIIANGSNNVNSDAVINSYCSFNPGGDYNTITGTLTLDTDNNGCDGTDVHPSNVRVNITDGVNNGAAFTSTTGDYTFYTQAMSYLITPAIENPTWFTFSPPTALVAFFDNNNNISTNNFCITANGVHPDLEVVIAPITRARPGFNAVYTITYRNKGNQTLNGVNTFSFDDAKIDFVSASQTPDLQNVGNLYWDFGVLQPFESRSITITLHINAPTDTPAVNIGDVLNFTATVDPIAGDETPSDNTFQFSQTVVGAYDPNDVTCIEGNMVSPSEIGNYLHYVINFENTGNADAENIVVRDVIDANQFDINSLQLMNSSAPVTARLTGNVAEFIFQNINLHSGGHGNILIKVKSKNTLVQGDTVSKKASIYFDYNAPVDTNMENTIFQALSNPNVAIDASILVYPNPTKGQININCNSTIKSVELYDIQGRLLETDLINETNAVIDISNHSNGVYFLRIISDKGIGVQKIVRE